MPDNPFAHGAPATLLPQPCILVIFGAAGDLSWRKLMPAVYNLNVDGVIPANFATVGFGLSNDSSHIDPDEYIRRRSREGISKFSRQSRALARMYSSGSMWQLSLLRPNPTVAKFAGMTP